MKIFYRVIALLSVGIFSVTAQWSEFIGPAFPPSFPPSSPYYQTYHYTSCAKAWTAVSCSISANIAAFTTETWTQDSGPGGSTVTKKDRSTVSKLNLQKLYSKSGGVCTGVTYSKSVDIASSVYNPTTGITTYTPNETTYNDINTSVHQDCTIPASATVTETSGPGWWMRVTKATMADHTVTPYVCCPGLTDYVEKWSGYLEIELTLAANTVPPTVPGTSGVGAGTTESAGTSGSQPPVVSILKRYDATDSGVVRVSRSGSTASSLSVSYTRSGPAAYGVNYTSNPSSTTVTIPAGASYKDIILTGFGALSSATFTLNASANFNIDYYRSSATFATSAPH